MKIRLGKGAVSAVTVSVLMSGVAQASQTFAVRDLGAATQVRSTILTSDSQNVPVYAEHHEKDAEGKCGEGKCGDEKKDEKTAEGKCGEGKCGDMDMGEGETGSH